MSDWELGSRLSRDWPYKKGFANTGRKAKNEFRVKTVDGFVEPDIVVDRPRSGRFDFILTLPTGWTFDLVTVGHGEGGFEERRLTAFETNMADLLREAGTPIPVVWWEQGRGRNVRKVKGWLKDRTLTRTGPSSEEKVAIAFMKGGQGTWKGDGP